ncbi:family 20 glycosylhydrolase [uncultured Dokdonia sp.]|uniref:family 20 glycosylhydrolase n=1 Tax=uncultured Dokdonia sp. TaxID=575653 RepID=UPI00262C16E2|nr:family 20 glycosylhydrolase [uncultured Dokdonia sp.]
MESQLSSRLVLSIDIPMPEEAYKLVISDDAIVIQGGSDRAVRYGIITLSQLLVETNKSLLLPKGIITDQPDHEYRSLMIDLSRNWHSVNTLKQLIVLAGFYKVKYVHLHLTDDGLFTFSSDAFPELRTEKHYSKEDLMVLNAFAKAYGVTLIPEIDMLGHSNAFIRADAQRWGIENSKENYYTLNMGSEQVYEGIQTLLEEVAEAFPESPYIHIGGDEVYMGGFENDPQVEAYMKAHELESLTDLYHHFIVRVGTQVKAIGKTPMIWTGFELESEVKIPKDFVIMAWNMTDYTPQKLAHDGYIVINASWQPLYVVNNRKWSPETIYDWSPNQWKGDQTPKELPGHRVKDSTSMIIGGIMCAWEQGQYKELITLRKRLAAMSERLWNTNATDYGTYASRNQKSDQQLEAILFPFTLTESGLTQGDWDDANRYENFEFEDLLSLHIKSAHNDIEVRYTQDGRIPTNTDRMYSLPIILKESGLVSFQAFRNGTPIGQTLEKKYFLAPIQAKVTGIVNDLPPHSWENHKFADTATFHFSSKRDGVLRYTTDGSTPTVTSSIYTDSILLKDSKTIKVGLFDTSGDQIGASWYEEYVQLGLETSLTTGKPVSTCHGDNELGVPSLINNGEIARWDHWGTHTNGDNWVIIDLEQAHELTRFKTYTFWDGYRYYEYTIDVSLDGISWKQVVDQSENRKLSVSEGQEDIIKPTKARYVRLNLIRNSANPGLHLVEFQAFAD